MVWARITVCLGWLSLPLVCGCQLLFAPKGPPNDPLFVVRKPAEGKPELTPPVMMAFSEPELPRDPFLKEHQPGIAGAVPRRVPAMLTNRVLNPDLRDTGADDRKRLP